MVYRRRRRRRMTRRGRRSYGTRRRKYRYRKRTRRKRRIPRALSIRRRNILLPMSFFVLHSGTSPLYNFASNYTIEQFDTYMDIFKGLYNYYRINRLIITLYSSNRFLQAGSAISTNDTSGEINYINPAGKAPLLCTRISRSSDETYPGDFTQIEDNPNWKIRSMSGKAIVKSSWKPNTTNISYETSLQSAYDPQYNKWFHRNDTLVKYYGRLHTIVSDATTDNPVDFRIKVTAIVELKEMDFNV